MSDFLSQWKPQARLLKSKSIQQTEEWICHGSDRAQAVILALIVGVLSKHIPIFISEMSEDMQYPSETVCFLHYI